MFGHFKGFGRDAHAGPQKHGRGHWRKGSCPNADRPESKGQKDTRTCLIKMEGNGVQSETAGACPLCKNHCPLDAPGCDKGKSYEKAFHAAKKGV